MPKRLYYTLSILLGLAGLCVIPFVVGFEDLLRTIGQVGWLGILIFIANSSCTLIIPAMGWWLLMRAEGIPVSLGTTVLANLMGFPLNFVTPSMYLGGEPLKVVYISRVCNVTKRRVLATIIVAKFQELGGLILAMIVATALLVWHTDYFTVRNEALLVVVMLVLAGLCGIVLYTFIGRLQPLVTLLDFLTRSHLLVSQIARVRAYAEELEERLHTVFADRPRVFCLAQAVTCLSAVSVFIRPWIFFRTLPNFGIGFDQLCILFVLTTLVNAFTLIPGALGLFEATMAGYADASGLGDDKGAAFAIVNRISDLTLVTLGCWLIAHYGLARIARGIEEEKDTATASD
jgi:hypothetical protein